MEFHGNPDAIFRKKLLLQLGGVRGANVAAMSKDVVMFRDIV